MRSDEESHRVASALRAPTSNAFGGTATNGRLPLRNTWLTGPDLFDWLALRRVSQGGVAQAEHGNQWFHHGRLIFGWLHDPLIDLVTTERIALTSGDPWGMCRARLTAAGCARFAELADRAKGRIAPTRPHPCQPSRGRPPTF